MGDRSSRSSALFAVFAACLLLGCASVGGHLEEGRASARRGDLRAARVSFHAALSRAQKELEGEHFVHLQLPPWKVFADACVTLGEFLVRVEGLPAAETVFSQCLGYASASAKSPYFSALVASRIEAAWSLAARKAGRVAPAIGHGILAGALQSTIGRKQSAIVLEHRELQLASSMAMFSSMSAGAAITTMDRRTSTSGEEAGLNPRFGPSAKADAQYAMLSAVSVLPSGQAGRYEALLGRLPYLDRAVGVRVTLGNDPTLAQIPQVRSLLVRAWSVEMPSQQGLVATEQDIMAFADELEAFYRLLRSAQAH